MRGGREEKEGGEAREGGWRGCSTLESHALPRSPHTVPTTHRDYIGSRLVAFAQAHEHVKVTTELKRNVHPVVQAEYGTSWSRVG